MSRNYRKNGRKKKPAWKTRMKQPHLWYRVTGEVHGSGPAPGVLEASSRAPSLNATRNYCVPRSVREVGVEYIYHPSTNAIVYGLLPLGPSAHIRLAETIKLPADTKDIVAGHLVFDHRLRIVKTNEHTGHFPGNWTDEARQMLSSLIAELLPGYHHEHERYSA